MQKKNTILHICFDYPDRDSRPKTKAIKNLVESAINYDHIVISLNRRNNPFRTGVEKYNNLIVFNIFFLKYGIFLNFFLQYAAKKISRHIKDIEFDLIHSHKLTFEGVIGHYLAKKIHKKHIVTLRGNTDLKVLRIKRFSKKRYLEVLNKSSAVISVSPWLVKKINTFFDKEFQINILPNISFIERFRDKEKPIKENSNTFITTFIFERNNHVIKNLHRLLQAFSLLLKKYPHLKMKIIGDGSQRYIVERFLDRYQLKNHVILPGYQKPDQLRNSMQDCIGFLMPSYPETFGLVYLEALATGLPLVYSKNAGIDGYFPNHIALGVNHRSVADISNAMESLFLEQKNYKKAVEVFKTKGGLVPFETKKVVEKYILIIEKVVRQ